MGGGAFLKEMFVSTFFEYDTPKTVHIHSKVVGVLNRLVQFLIIAYVIGYMFVVHKGYQHFDRSAVSGTTTKLKGIVYTNAADDRGVGERLWDVADLVVPAEENGAFFITTNIISTHNQTQGECAESERYNCTNDTDCPSLGTLLHRGHGVSTGRCDVAAGYCLVKTWCPVENDTLAPGAKYAMFNQTGQWTVMIKNHVYFPYFAKTRSNFIESVNKDYLGGCLYHHKHHPHCPIFKLKDIVSLAETKTLEHPEYSDEWYNKMAAKGGVITIKVVWDCNFDKDETECKPKYVFDRLDNYKGNALGSGYNFRYPIYYYEDGISKRNLVKAYGILFVLETDATARAFNIVTFSLNLGSGIALLGMAAICADLFLNYFHRNKTFFKKHIYVDIKEEEGKHKYSEVKRSSTDFTTCPTISGHADGISTNGRTSNNLSDSLALNAPLYMDGCN